MSVATEWIILKLNDFENVAFNCLGGHYTLLRLYNVISLCGAFYCLGSCSSQLFRTCTVVVFVDV